METTVMNVAVSQGIWAVLAVFLLIYIVIESLTEKFQILNQVQSDLKEIKDNLFNKN